MSATSDLQPNSPALLAVPDSPAALAAGWPGLKDGAAAHGIVLSAAELAQFARYQALLLEWNARFNLTAITAPAAIEERLFLDALLLLPALDALIGVETAPRLVDIGSGAGFPALPLAIMRPHWRYTLIEATGKKVSFLTAAIAELGLAQTRAVHGRAEEIAREPGYRASWQLATARAVASLPALVELTLPLLRIGGHAVLPKGRDLATELAAGEAAAALIGGRIAQADLIPGTKTRIVIVDKTRATPAAYPRRAGLPARQPLGGEATIPSPTSASPRRRVQPAAARPEMANAGRRNAR